MLKSFRVCSFCLFFSILAGTGPAAVPPDYSKEAFVIEQMATKVIFSEDGSRDWRQTLSVRIKSESAVRQFGVLAFDYRSENETIAFEYVRVRKPDGSVIETPPASIIDVTADIARSAPSFSDLHQKQIPVKALGVDDVLEYSVHTSQKNIETPGQFWYDQAFVSGAVVLSQMLEIGVPKQKYLQVSSPKLKPETREEADRRIYLWKYSQLAASKPDDPKKAESDEDEAPAVRVTSFKNWEEVGDWWSKLVVPQQNVTPAIQEKAAELTKGLSSDQEKARAIYNYVATKYRYVSLSFGVGRYRPHTAAEVLANQYGDCKDKHVLFAALLKASGIEAWPALIGAGVKFDDKIPTPGQFNHVITVLPQNGNFTWLDTTTEVAPFGLLVQTIRDQPALVIPAVGKSKLVKTPLDPPLPLSQAIQVTATLDKDGTLAGHFDLQTNSDGALDMRSGFRLVAPAQWQTLVQQISYGMGFGGDVSNVEVENLENIEKPFHYSYDYIRKNYSDWAEHKITFPVPPQGFGPGAEADKPKESFWAGAKGNISFKASIKMPPGFTPDVPADQNLSSDFANYESHYLWKDGVFSVERRMLIKQAKVVPQQWADYQKFAKGLASDQTTFISLSDSGEAKLANADLSDPNPSNPEARQLLKQAQAKLEQHNLNQGLDLIARAREINPKEPGLWRLLAVLAGQYGKTEEALTDLRKEIEFHPTEISAYLQLSTMLHYYKHDGEAIPLLKKALSLQPENNAVARQLSMILIEAKRYEEVLSLLEKPIAAAPEDYLLQSVRVKALRGIGRNEQALTEASAIAQKTSEPLVLNNLAYEFGDAGLALDRAREWAEKAVSEGEKSLAHLSLANVENKDLSAVSLLSNEWDTLGWICFKQNDLPAAERYIAAAWQLGQHSDEASHLAEIYQKQQNHSAALHFWRLALAVDKNNEVARRHVQDAALSPAQFQKNLLDDASELAHLRTVAIPAIPKQTASAEFLVLLSPHGVEDAQFISGANELKDSLPALKSASYGVKFPDTGPEMLVRRGVLSCSLYTKPSCQFTFLLPANTQAPNKPANQTASPSRLVPPTLQSKINPTYSQAAIDAKLEGIVLLSIVVNEQGLPEDISVIKPLGMGLDEKAVECVKQWRFNPGTKDGHPVKVASQVQVEFRFVRGQVN